MAENSKHGPLPRLAGVHEGENGWLGIQEKIPMERPIKPLCKLVLWVRHPKDSKPPTPPNHA